MALRWLLTSIVLCRSMVIVEVDSKMRGLDPYARMVNGGLTTPVTTNQADVFKYGCPTFQLAKLDLDPNEKTPGRKVVRTIGEALVESMEMALAEGKPGAAQLVACEAVVLAETQDHQNWPLIGEVMKDVKGQVAKVLKEAHDQVEDEEDEHLYHTKGWCRELWIESLGMKAVLPPPEEVKQVETAIGAARAEQARTKMASSK